MYSIHGGDWASYEEEYGRGAVDFSASIAPFPMPGRVRKAAQEALCREDRYPDPQQRKLRRAIAGAYTLREEEILCGNGAAELIWRLAFALPPGKAVITAPSFGEYRTALERCGHTVSAYRLTKENGFRLQEDFLQMLTRETDVVILCEPNNPTGVTTASEMLAEIAKRCRDNGTLLAVDESFYDFLDPETYPSMLGRLREWPVLVIRSFTKLYAMASLRLGWCVCADIDLLQKMRLSGQPWPLSSPSVEAGIAALKEEAFAKSVREKIAEERENLSGKLKRLGCSVIEGEANYLLFYDLSESLGEKLKERGILLRDCSNFEGLETGWYRAAVRSREENDRLVKAMEEVHGEINHDSGDHVRRGQEFADNGTVPDFSSGRNADGSF